MSGRPSLSDIGTGVASLSPPDIADLEKRYSIPDGLYQRLLDKGEASADDAVSPKGAIGRAQLMPDTARDLGVDPHDRAQNVEGGAKYLSQLYKQFGDWKLAVAAYNAGPGAVEKAGGVPDFPETQAYVQRVYGERRPLAEIATQGEPSETEVGPSGDIQPKDTKQPFTPAQTQTVRLLAKGGLIDPTKPEGDVQRPWVQRQPEDTFAAGQFYIDAEGKVRQTPGAADKAGIPTGLGQSVSDALASVSRLLPGTDDSTIGSMARGNQLIYEAAHGENDLANAGRVTGNFAAAALPTSGALEGLALAGRAAPLIAPATDFLRGASTTFKANPLLWGASKAVSGAGQGAMANLLTSGRSDQSLGDLAKEGAVAGAVLGPVIPAAMGALGGAGRAVRSIAQPFSETGRNQLVDDFLVRQAGAGPKTPDLSEYVPGSRPTLAQATGNPGIAMLERGVKTVNPTPFEALSRSNQQARELAVDAARGDRQSLEDLIAARSAQTDPLREAAFAKTQPADPAPVVQKIDEILASPSGQRDAVTSALTNIRGKLIDENGAAQTDPEQLWGIRQAIGDMLSPLAAGTKADGRLASRELMNVRDALDPVIEGGAPGFKGYLKSYAEASKQVNAQEYLQGLNLTTADGTITLGKIDSALKRIEAARGKPGVNAAKNVDDATLGRLYAIRDDLVRQSKDQVGRGTGSDTAQKLASNKLLEGLSVPAAMGVGVHNPLAGAALGLTKIALSSKNKELFNLLTGKLVDPSLAPPLDQVNMSVPSSTLLGRLARGALLPAAVQGTNRLISP